MEVAILLAVGAYLATHTPNPLTWAAVPWVVVAVVVAFRVLKVWG